MPHCSPGYHNQIVKEFFNVEVVDEAAAAADGLGSRVKIVFSCDDDGAAALDTISRFAIHAEAASRSRLDANHLCFSLRVCCLLHMRQRILIRDCRGSG